MKKDTCHTDKNLVYDFAHHESPIASEKMVYMAIQDLYPLRDKGTKYVTKTVQIPVSGVRSGTSTTASKRALKPLFPRTPTGMARKLTYISYIPLE